MEKIDTKVFVSSSPSVKITSSSANPTTCSITQRNENNESITLIWYDPEIEIMEELREINDYVRFYANKEECINYIASVKNERILFVITFEENTSIILQQVYASCAIDSIFIFCSKSLEINYHNQLLKEYGRKIIGVFRERHELIDSIRKNVKLVTNQFQTFSFYNQHHEKSMRDLTKESAEFLWFQMFKDVVLQMSRDTHAKQQLVDFCRSYYHGNKRQLESIDYFEQTYPETINALQWYTKQSFVYKLINKALRTEDIKLLHTFRFFISDLSTSLTTEFNQQTIGQQQHRSLKLYRGCQLSNDELERAKQNIGNLISTNGFLSTSRFKDVALIYAGTSTDNTHHAILSEIECNLNELNNSVIIADISAYSNFPDEQEVLFDLGSTFKIVSIDEEKDLKVWLIKMKVTDEGANSVKAYIELNRKENDETSAVIMFGNLLAAMGKFDQAQNYFEAMLLNDPQEQEVDDIARIYNRLGTVYHNKGEIDKSVQYYQMALDLMTNSGPSHMKNSAGPLNNIGISMYHTKQFDKALEFYFQALEIDKQFFGEECLKVANTLHNIALVYEDKESFQLALNYYERGLKIQRKLLPKDHVNIASSLNSIGTVYQRMTKYDCAFEYHEQALKMRQKLLSTEHDDIAESFHNIGEVLDDQRQLNEALEYYFVAVKIREKIFDCSNGHSNLAMTLRNIGTRLTKPPDLVRRLLIFGLFS